MRTLATPLASLVPSAPTRPAPPAVRHRNHSLAAVAVFTALSLGSTQAFAQAPSAAPDRTRSADAPLAVDAPEPGPDIAPAPEPTPDIAPAPEPEPLPPPQAEPAPPPEPMMGPAPPPSPEPLPAQHNPVRAQKLRNAGIGTMIAGGVVSVLGFGLTLAFTMQGRKRHGEQALAEDENSRKDCSRMPSKECTSLAVQIDDLGKQVDSANRNAQIGGAAMLTGFAVLAVGGLLYRIGVRRMQPPSLGRLKLSPSLGGVVLSGRF